MQQNMQSDKADKTKNNNGKWAQSATQAAEGFQDTAKNIYNQAMDAGSDFISQANKKVPELVREYPVYATLGGLVVGFLLGASLIGRRGGASSEL